jgi:hypothetical protein
LQYMLMHAIDENVERGETQPARDGSSTPTWLEQDISRGVGLHGDRLRLTAAATTVKVRKGELLMSDGPFAETKEQVVGYAVLECSSLDEAVEWAAKHPSPLIGCIEVRPLRADRPAALLPPPREGKTRYMLLVCVGPDFAMGPQDEAEMGPATDAWVNEMDGNGVRLFGSQLEGADQARTVRVEDGQVLVADGPFAKTKEQIVGFDIIECANLDEALEVAAAHPMAKFGMIEVRPFWPFGEGSGRSGLGRSGPGRAG